MESAILVSCRECKGTKIGNVPIPKFLKYLLNGKYPSGYFPCWKCKGSGAVPDCRRCDNTGEVPNPNFNPSDYSLVKNDRDYDREFWDKTIGCPTCTTQDKPG